jgi:hypothetical protein
VARCSHRFVAGFAALSTALAYIVFFQILVRSGASNVMLVTLLLPVTAGFDPEPCVLVSR